MSGFGNRGSVLTSTTTIIVFAVFVVLGFGPQYSPLPPILSTLVLPLDIISGLTVGRLVNSISGSVPVASGLLRDIGKLATYFIVAVVLAKIKQSRGSTF